MGLCGSRTVRRVKEAVVPPPAIPWPPSGMPKAPRRLTEFPTPNDDWTRTFALYVLTQREANAWDPGAVVPETGQTGWGAIRLGWNAGLDDPYAHIVVKTDTFPPELAARTYWPEQIFEAYKLETPLDILEHEFGHEILGWGHRPDEARGDGHNSLMSEAYRVNGRNLPEDRAHLLRAIYARYDEIDVRMHETPGHHHVELMRLGIKNGAYDRLDAEVQREMGL